MCLLRPIPLPALQPRSSCFPH
uniref:Uncharacterized protein n=1 Tax=Anguilla anguilla TaxID=7936 RepID=A0A0E9SV24_ANGAN